MTPTKDERRQQILEAALRAFSENGYAKTTMDDIVKLSGLSKGTLYWHFKNKQDLFIATIMMLFSNIDRELASLVQQDAPAEDRIRAFALQVGTFFKANKPYVGLLVDAFFQSYQSEESLQAMQELYQNYIVSVETIIRQGIDNGEFREVDPHTAAIALMAGGDGIALYMLLEPSWDVAQTYTTTVEWILRGLKTED